MERLNEVDKDILLWKTPYIVEAYNIFYGEYPNVSRDKEKTNETVSNFQRMLCILSEYDILDEKYTWGYDDIDFAPVSSKVYYQYGLMATKFAKIEFPKEDLEKLCKERPLSVDKQNAIKSIKYLIDKKVEEENEDYFTFLNQICNVIYFRNRLFCPYDDEEYEMAFSKSLSNGYPQFEMSEELVKQRLNFITSKLRLLINTSPCSMNRVIYQAKMDGMEIENTDVEKTKDKVFTKYK